MKNLKIGKKLLVGFGFLIAIVVLVTALGAYSMIDMDSNYSHLLHYPFERYAATATIEMRLADLRRIQNRAAIYMNDPNDPIAGIDEQEVLFREAWADTLSTIGTYRRLVDSDDQFTSQRKAELNSKATALENALNDYANNYALLIFEAARGGATAETSEEVEKYDHLMLDLVRDSAIPVSQATEALDYMFNSARTVMSTSSADITAQSQTMIITLIVVAVAAVVIATLLAAYISKIISSPLVVLTEFMQHAAKTGNLSFTGEQATSIAKYSQNKDELGQCIAATSEFMHEINEEMDLLEKIGGGDLTITPKVLSEHDKVGKALNKVVDNLNNMFSEIQSSTNQVATGSKQIADGAQSLAQGSTEQAASVQQLSSSITAIAQKTKENADMASRAASLASNIKTSAEKGSGQMSEMMMAVRDINESSQNISKVIKSIDDIAFQTNILALNAAVEAARAGQHGKGFAVVAEEVRNLAAKSAEAAKDTESLIADSIAKAELGSKIADETSESLTEIVSGIGESSKLVSEIASSSEEQTLSITQINTGIDQVAQVTQQNSATAEESAAASEEMSGQSAMLEQLISQFKLRNTQGFGQLPSTSNSPAPVMDSGSDDFGGFDSSDGFGKY